MDKGFVISIFLIISIFTAFLLLFPAKSDVSWVEYRVLESEESDDLLEADIYLHTNRYVTVTDKDGNVKFYDEGHNTFTNAGKDHVKLFLGNSAQAGEPAAYYIAVGNGTAPGAASTTLDSEIAESGLTRAAGTYTSTGTGAWKLEKVFSVTGTVNSINSTALLNASSSGTMFAGDTFANTNVQNGDSLNITWTLSVS